MEGLQYTLEFVRISVPSVTATGDVCSAIRCTFSSLASSDSGETPERDTAVDSACALVLTLVSAKVVSGTSFSEDIVVALKSESGKRAGPNRNTRVAHSAGEISRGASPVNSGQKTKPRSACSIAPTE